MRNVLFIALFFSTYAFAQMNQDSLFAVGICDKEGYCVPQLPDVGRPKGIEVDYGGTWYTPIKTLDANGTHNDTLRKNRNGAVSLRFPVTLKPGFKLFIGLKYRAEEFKFEKDKILSSEFQEAINRKPLRTFGSSILFSKPYKGNSYLAGRVSLRLSGDFARKELQDYLRPSATVIFGKRASYDVVWGGGLSYSYTFGRQLLIPVFAYSRKFNEKWSLAALLPAKISARYEINEKNILKIESRLDGEKYNITLNEITEKNLFLERSDWSSALIYEREIHDFIWIGVKAGNRFNISFDLSERNTFINREAPEILNELPNTWFVQASIFLVPPKKWVKKQNK